MSDPIPKTLRRYTSEQLCDAIDDHNHTLQTTCEARAEHCEPWTSRGRRCPECPLQYAITNEQIEHVARLKQAEVNDEQA